MYVIHLSRAFTSVLSLAAMIIKNMRETMSKSTISYIGTFIFLVVTGITNAQITINQTDLQNLIGNSYDVNSYETTTASDLTSLAALTGQNQTFDFTTITSFNQDYHGTITYLNLPASIPGNNDPFFTDANVAIEMKLSGVGQVSDSTAWAYFKITSDSVNEAGLVFVSQTDINSDGIAPDTVKFGYNPYLLYTKLPLTYGTAWKDSTTNSVSVTGSGVLFTQTIQIDAQVDGYGTLKLPGKTMDCLRLKIMTTSILTMGSIKLTTKEGSVEFITKSGAIVSAEIELDENGNPLSANYTDQASATPIETTPGHGIAEGYRLNQNYPNPFNPSTVISYDLKKAGRVKLQVYNSLGQLVANLVDGTQAAGTHKVTFNAAELNSGLYFYKLQADNFVQTKKMILVK